MTWGGRSLIRSILNEQRLFYSQFYFTTFSLGEEKECTHNPFSPSSPDLDSLSKSTELPNILLLLVKEKRLFFFRESFFLKRLL